MKKVYEDKKISVFLTVPHPTFIATIKNETDSRIFVKFQKGELEVEAKSEISLPATIEGQYFLDEIKNKRFEIMENYLPKAVSFSLNDLFDDEEIDLLMDKVGDKLSDKYGFCVKDFTFNAELKAEDIEWDKED